MTVAWAALWVFTTVIAAGLAVERLRIASSVLAVGRPRLRLPLLDRWLRHRAEARSDRELPNVLETVARALRAGHNLPSAIVAATPELPARLAHEWRTLAVVAADRGVAEAVSRWHEHRPSSRAVALAASALALAADVGGAQARAVDAVATTLRQRLALAAEVRALTSQARASAVVVCCAPLGFVVVAAGLEPSYLPFLVRTPAGLACLVAGLALDSAGVAWMYRIARAVT